MRISFFLLFLAASFLSVSCGDDNDAADCTIGQFNNEVNAAISALNAAGNAWANDPTNSGLCNDFVQAANDYLDSVEKFEGCGVISQADYQAQLQAARDALAQAPPC